MDKNTTQHHQIDGEFHVMALTCHAE